ncbi:Heat shock protein GrpE [hydrothermal vent metagenome]|uniref:Heat shock protein GrpE n=1 Tax=hydrothermal vent metagenome TaxID=652676 RepID=A0A1W1BFL7_9ZZZZ
MGKENENSSIEVEIETPESEEVVEAEESEVSELEEMKALVASWEDKFLRTHASFENSKRLLVKDKATAVAYANESFAKDMLSVVDSFDSALAMINATGDEDSSDDVLSKIKEGLGLTYSQLTKVLEKNGIKVIDSEGEFDPEVHQAIMQVESPEHEAGQIVQVLQKGYTIKERVLRPAMVSTAK